MIYLPLSAATNSCETPPIKKKKQRNFLYLNQTVLSILQRSNDCIAKRRLSRKCSELNLISFQWRTSHLSSSPYIWSEPGQMEPILATWRGGVKYLYQRGVILYSSEQLYFIPATSLGRARHYNSRGFISSYFSSPVQSALLAKSQIVQNLLKQNVSFNQIIFVLFLTAFT